MRPLKLDKDLVCFDIESTSADPQTARIVEIALTKVSHIDGTTQKFSRKINPQMPIPPDSTAVHGITDEDVKDCPPFNRIAKGLFELVTDCHLLTFSGNQFDIPLLYNEFLRCGIVWDISNIASIDSSVIYKRMRPRTLGACYREFCGAELADAHSAEADTNATMDSFDKMIEAFPELPVDDIYALALFTNYDKKRLDISGKFILNENNEICLNFGSYKGQVAKSQLGFLEWMLGEDKNFYPDAKKIAWDILQREKNKLSDEFLMR